MPLLCSIDDSLAAEGWQQTYCHSRAAASFPSRTRELRQSSLRSKLVLR